MHTFNVSINALRAARTHAPSKDVRYYLLSVHFDLEAGRIVATDGHRMFICAGPVVPGAGTFIMPSTLVDNVLKALGKRPLQSEVEVSHASGTIQFKTEMGTFSGTAIDGKFPDWRRVVPREVSGVSAQYNPEYLANAREALALYQGFKADKTAFKVAHNGDSPGICTTNDYSVVVIVMPMREVDACDAAGRAAWAVSMANAEAATAQRTEVA
jgi:DNA polymerase-3 subunit beta